MSLNDKMIDEMIKIWVYELYTYTQLQHSLQSILSRDKVFVFVSVLQDIK